MTNPVDALRARFPSGRVGGVDGRIGNRAVNKEKAEPPRTPATASIFSSRFKGFAGRVFKAVAALAQRVGLKSLPDPLETLRRGGTLTGAVAFGRGTGTELFAALKEFSAKEHSGENCEFLVAVEAFEKKPSAESARELMTGFVAQAAAKEVNLPSAVRKQIQDGLALAGNDPTKLRNIFQPACNEIQNLLVRDTIPRMRTALANGQFEW